MIDHNLYPVHMYGLTETYGPFTRTYFNEHWQNLPRDEHYKLLARQGTSFVTSAALRVVNSQFEDVKRDGQEIGEIVIRGNIVCKGYHDNVEETNKSFHTWFRSGDLAVMHPDGNIQILDRKKDIIISGGENISSIAVESVIVRYPNVLEAAVVGVPHSLYGEVPFAFVTARDPSVALDAQALRGWLRDQMGAYQVPKGIEIVKDLPKTSTGKVRKNVLRDEAAKIVQKIPDFDAKPSTHRVSMR
jgi:acyl-CoA synthetase (AMP-forming)/AMP-acid ligase II